MNFFYNRTVYRELDVEIPVCFRALDIYLPFAQTKEASLAENICRRMADIEYYANQIDLNLKKRKDLWSETIIIGTQLVSYYMACKALFDAVAITLNYIYKLNLSEKQQDFTKDKIWEELKNKDINLFNRYNLFKDLNYEIRDWRDMAVHRVTPFVILVGPGDPGEKPGEKFNIKFVAEKGAEMHILISKKRKPNFRDPLYHHQKWRRKLLKLCEEICEDLGSLVENI